MSADPKQTAHTPGPWHVDNTPGDTVPSLIYDSKGRGVADTGNNHRSRKEQHVNAEFIVRCVNSHDKLVEALEALYTETADYIHINNLGDVHHNRSMQLAEAALRAAKEGGHD